MNQTPTTAPMPHLTLIQSLEMARKHCEPLPGTIATNRLDSLPTHLNDINYWLNEANPLENVQLFNGSKKIMSDQNVENPSPAMTHLAQPMQSSLFKSFTLFDSMPHSPLIMAPSPTNEANSPLHLGSPITSPLSATSPADELSKCPIPGCKRTFKRPEHLRRHMRCHSETPLHKKAVERRRSQANIYSPTINPYMNSSMMSTLFSSSSTLGSPSIASPGSSSAFMGTPSLSCMTPMMDQHTMLSPFLSGLNMSNSVSSTPIDLGKPNNSATAALLSQSLNEAFQSPFLSFSSLDTTPFTPAQLQAELTIDPSVQSVLNQEDVGLGITSSENMKSFDFLEGELNSAFELVDSALDLGEPKATEEAMVSTGLWNSL
jgi:hypothetical protein